MRILPELRSALDRSGAGAGSALNRMFQRLQKPLPASSRGDGLDNPTKALSACTLSRLESRAI